MPRPCHKDHDFSPATCFLCEWCAEDSALGEVYREAWGETKAPVTQSKKSSQVCRHLGKRVRVDGKVKQVDCALA